MLALGLSNAPLAAQTAVSRGTISEILDSNQVYIQNNSARVNDVANRGQQVRTGSARAQVTFNTGAVARLSNNSALTIGQCAQLQRGRLLVNGAVNGCTGSITAGVRGTTYIIEVDEAGQAQVTVLDGEVVVTQQSDSSSGAAAGSAPSPPNGPLAGDAAQSPPSPAIAPSTQDSVTLTAGEKLATRPGERLGTAERLSVEDFVAILTGELFRSFLEQLPGMDNIRSSFQRLYPSVPFPLGAPELPGRDLSPPRTPLGL